MNREDKKIRVVSAVVSQTGHYLITQRRTQGSLPGLWEFPGGKVEQGEQDAHALKRELKERLSVDVDVGAKLGEKNHPYKDYTITLVLYEARLLPGQTLQNRGVQSHAWVVPQELGLYTFPDADQQALALLGVDFS